MPLWFCNLAVYCAQLALLIAAGALMVAVTRLREPRLRLIYWQVLLALGVLLPALEPWQTAPPIEQGMVQGGESLAHAGSAGIQAAASLPAHAASSFSIYQLVAILLLAGLAFRLLGLGLGLLRLRRSRLRASPVRSHAALEQFKAALGVSPAVLISEQISSPVTFGWRHPRVLLPQKFLQMDEARRRAILCHELLHVRRRDWLWHVVEEVLRCLFWFHLAVAWLVAQIRLCREQVVDREVVILAGSRREYLDALFEIASLSRTSRHAPALLFFTERHLKRRVELILKETNMSRKKLVLALSASLGGLLLAGVVVATSLPLRTSAAQLSSETSLNATIVRPDTHIFGNPHATVTVVEFGDFQCPACRKAASVAEQVRKSMGPKVRFAYRQFPLTRFHPQAEKAAEAAECAAEQGKFWQAVDYLSDHPLDFSSSGINQFAANLGLQPSRITQCLSSGTMAARVRQDISDGHALGVHSVPTFFIGNTRVVGALPYSRLHELIEQQLRTSTSAEDGSPSGRNLLAAAFLGPALGKGLTAQETSSASQKPDPARATSPQNNGKTSTNTNTNHNTQIDQDEIQRQIDQAMKHAQMAQQVPVEIDQAKIQEQIEQAMKQLKMAEAVTPKIDQAKINQQIQQAMKQLQMSQDLAPKIDQEKVQEQIEQAMKQVEKMNTPEMRKKMQEQMEHLKKMDTSEMRQHMQEQMDRLKKLESPEMGRQFEQAMAQARAAQDGAAQANKAELQRQLDEAKKQVEQARKDAQAAREEAQKAREDAMKARREAKEQQKAAKPAPSAKPKPVPAPPKEAAPPAAPAPPAPPKSPESAGIVGGVPRGVVGGVPGGVVGGVAGGKIGGVSGGQVKGVEGGHAIGVPGGITGGVVTAPRPPVPPSTAPKEVPPPPAATAPPAD
ncbi:MAG TPA: thioredoxin domain-containing protein [Terriglobia bacterium]|nr:thioredoxin domain-containing protein [Terriglobia bacterium]